MDLPLLDRALATHSKQHGQGDNKLQPNEVLRNILTGTKESAYFEEAPLLVYPAAALLHLGSILCCFTMPSIISCFHPLARTPITAALINAALLTAALLPCCLAIIEAISHTVSRLVPAALAADQSNSSLHLRDMTRNQHGNGRQQEPDDSVGVHGEIGKTASARPALRQARVCLPSCPARFAFLFESSGVSSKAT